MRSGFVTFEGIDGSGKTTVSRLVFEALRDRGERVHLTAEPTESWLGQAVRRSYVDDVGPLAESFLFLADRASHVAEIRGRLAAGDIVLCDRYAHSTYAYQGARLEGQIRDPVGFLRRVSEPWILEPDVVLYLRLPPEEGLARIQGREGRVRFEDPALLRKVAANYERLSREKGFVVLDARKSPGEVASAALRAMERTLSRRRGEGGTRSRKPERGTRARRP